MQHIKVTVLVFKFKDIKITFKEGEGEIKPRDVIVEVTENGKLNEKSLSYIEKLPIAVYLETINKWQSGFLSNEELKKKFH